MFVISVPASKVSSCMLLIMSKKYKTCTNFAGHATHVVLILFMSHFLLDRYYIGFEYNPACVPQA